MTWPQSSVELTNFFQTSKGELAAPCVAAPDWFPSLGKEKVGDVFRAFQRGDRIKSGPKFAVGQIVDFESRTTSMLRARGPYEVVRVVPGDESTPRTYHLKSKVEPFKRAASEHDLVAVGAPPSESHAATWLQVPRKPRG